MFTDKQDHGIMSQSKDEDASGPLRLILSTSFRSPQCQKLKREEAVLITRLPHATPKCRGDTGIDPTGCSSRNIKIAKQLQVGSMTKIQYNHGCAKVSCLSAAFQRDEKHAATSSEVLK